MVPLVCSAHVHLQAADGLEAGGPMGIPGGEAGGPPGGEWGRHNCKRDVQFDSLLPPALVLAN